MAKPPPDNAESRRLYEAHFLNRYLRVLDVLDGDAIEIAVRPGHALRVIHIAGDDAKVTRIIVSPLHKPAPKSK